MEALTAIVYLTFGSIVGATLIYVALHLPPAWSAVRTECQVRKTHRRQLIARQRELALKQRAFRNARFQLGCQGHYSATFRDQAETFLTTKRRA